MVLSVNYQRYKNKLLLLCSEMAPFSLIKFVAVIMCIFINLVSLGLGLAYECASWDKSFHTDIAAWIYMALIAMKVLMAVKIH